MDPRTGERVGEPCADCHRVGLRPTADHGATVNQDTIRRLWSSHSDTGVGMKDHPGLVRVDRDHDDANSFKAYRKDAGFTSGEPEPFEAGTPGGQYRRRNLHAAPEGDPIAGGGTEALDVSWYQSSGYIVVKGTHPNGIEYPPFHGDKITPVPPAALEALQRQGAVGGPGERAATSAEVTAFLDAHQQVERLALLARRRREVATAPDGKRHRRAVTHLSLAFRDAVAG